MLDGDCHDVIPFNASLCDFYVCNTDMFSYDLLSTAYRCEVCFCLICDTFKCLHEDNVLQSQNCLHCF